MGSKQREFQQSRFRGPLLGPLGHRGVGILWEDSCAEQERQSVLVEEDKTVQFH